MNFIQLSLAFLLVSPIVAVSFKCAALDGTTYFDLSGLAAAATHDGKLFFPMSFGGYNFELALCADIIPTCKNTDNNFHSVVYYSDPGDGCSGYLNSGSLSVTAHYVSETEASVDYFEQVNDVSIKVTVHCNENLEKPNFRILSADPKTIIIDGNASQACALFSLSYFYSKYPIPFALAFMITGLIIAFLGFKIFTVVLFLMGTFVVGFIIFNLIYQLAASSITMNNSWVIWLIMGASLIVGLIVGFFAAKYQKYCFFLAGACLGGILGFIVYTAFLTSVQGVWLMYVLIVVCALVGACAAYFFKDPILITGTSLMGSYLFVTGIGFFVTQIPSIMDIYNLINKGDFNLTVAMYLYLAGILVLAIIAVVVQCKFRPQQKEEGGDSYDDEAERILSRYRSLEK